MVSHLKDIRTIINKRKNIMSQTQFGKGMKLETPATYRIRVQGKLDESWFDRLGGMAITPDTAVDKPAVTILVGHLPDQAALSGVLNTLYEVHLPLLSVENLDE
jgi:hypothetical protein